MAWLYFGEIDGDVARAVGDEARHAVKVARVRVGERISIGDGAGTVATGPVFKASADAVTISVEDTRVDSEPDPELWLVQALAKSGRDELAVQAATELGASAVVPWAASRSVVRWADDKAERGQMRWAAIAREAAKQSLRSRVPEVAPLAATRDLSGALLVLEPGAPTALSEVALPTTGRIYVVVGPEGGIAPDELATLEASGGTLVRLGPEVLRASTAGPAALAVLNARLGRW